MTHSVTFVRRRALGRGSSRTVRQVMTEERGIQSYDWRTWRENTPPNTDVYIRWGCTANVPNGRKVLNKAEAIHKVNNKAQFAARLAVDGLSPHTQLHDGTHYGVASVDPNQQYIIRPRFHSRGRNIHTIPFRQVSSFQPTSASWRQGWYARPLINKSAEFRVYVMFGRIVSIAQKIPTNPDAVAWNHSLGSVFQNVRWDGWTPEVCLVALHASSMSLLDYAAVDVMVEEGTNRAYIIEINSAGSLPPNEDGTPTYRAQCVAKALAYHLDIESYSHFEEVNVFNNWRDVIHPAIWDNHPQRIQ